MGEAIFGLLGVIVGAVIAGAFELWRDRTRADASLKAAKRLVFEEIHVSWTIYHVLAKIEDDAEMAVEAKAAYDSGHLRNTAWRAYQGVLAEGLDDGAWKDVAQIYYVLGIMLGFEADGNPRKHVESAIEDTGFERALLALDAEDDSGDEKERGARLDALIAVGREEAEAKHEGGSSPPDS